MTRTHYAPWFFECDVCHTLILDDGFWLPSPHASWGAFAALCGTHSTLRRRLVARCQYAWAKWTP